jgi:hypothetical protein
MRQAASFFARKKTKDPARLFQINNSLIAWAKPAKD